MDHKRSTWEQLSKYESHDFVGKWFQRRHGKELNAGRTKEIISCFTQGREYFASAAGAANSVRPLLLYYGVLALSRGVILLRDGLKSESSLKPSHGLEVVGWQSILSSGIQNVLDLQVRATAGTFTELAATTVNSQATAWWNDPGLQLGYYGAVFPTPSFTSNGSLLTLDDLFSRDHRFRSLYAEATERPSRVHLGEIVASTNGLEVSVFAMEGVSTREAVATRFGLPDGTVIQERRGTRRMQLIPNVYFIIEGSDLNALKSKLPANHYDWGDVIFLYEDYTNGDKFSDFLRMFIASYILGMLVRYYPSRWMSLLRNDKGDAAQPLIMAAINGIEAEFPLLLSHEINR